MAQDQKRRRDVEALAAAIFARTVTCPQVRGKTAGALADEALADAHAFYAALDAADAAGQPPEPPKQPAPRGGPKSPTDRPAPPG